MASGISILGTDCNSNMAWSAKERYVARNFGFLGLERGQHTVDGRNPAPVEVDSLSHYLQGFIHPKGGCLGFLSHPPVCRMF